MMAARWPRAEPLDERLLLIEARRGTWRDGRIRDMPSWLVPGDLVVVNDAATLPASFRATDPRGVEIELRLAADMGDGRWRAVVFGEGDWRTRTEDRSTPPLLAPSDRLHISSEPGRRTEDDFLTATVEEVAPLAPRLVIVRFSLQGAALWLALYRYGRPVQYSHLAGTLQVWHAQTPFASRPWAVEMPSAGRPMAWGLVAEMRSRGIRLAALTHAAGLSATGDSAIDATLPFPERFDLPRRTIEAIAQARAEGRRVVAVGTTVVRALEGCAAMHGGELVAGEATTDLRIGPGFRPRIVDGVLSGLHDVGSSHRALLRAFAPESLLAGAFAHAEASGYLGHEFGDACLIL
jgi:S-adenosylmethionine:tRNA ribosyltransferase-isomerase